MTLAPIPAMWWPERHLLRARTWLGHQLAGVADSRSWSQRRTDDPARSARQNQLGNETDPLDPYA